MRGAFVRRPGAEGNLLLLKVPRPLDPNSPRAYTRGNLAWLPHTCMTPVQSPKFALAMSAALLCACSPSEKDARLEALTGWSPKVPPLEAPLTASAGDATRPAKTFADLPPENKEASAKRTDSLPGPAKPAQPVSAQLPSAVQVKEFRPKELPRSDTCEALPLLQKLPKSTTWFEVSDYNAGFAEGVQFLPGSDSVMRIAKIRVAHPGPVALLLGAYEPNVWQIETAPGTTIVGVWASGYHAQRVTGNSRDHPCGPQHLRR